MKVLKFGGTSVGSAERMHALVHLINEDAVKIIVLSAMSGTTNSLVEIATVLYAKQNQIARQLIDELENKYKEVIKQLYKTETSLNKGKELLDSHFNYLRSFTMDLFTVNEERAILAQGELLSTALFHFYLEEIEIDSVLLPALNFMRIDENEEPDLKYIEANIQAELAKYPNTKLFITQGYICRNAFGEIDNLKRGGSDYTATIIGAAIRSEEIQIWTDIDGMHNNDPRIVDKTHPIAELSFDEAAELAYFGAKILHPTCILPAQLRNIPVRLLNTMQPAAKGTLISSKTTGDSIKAVAAKDGITAIKIKSGRMLLAYGFLRAVFEIFERYKTPIDMITTSEVAVSLTIDNTKNLDAIKKELEEFCSIEVDSDLTIVCIVGSFTAEKQGYALRIFDALKNIPIRMISYGGSENNISILVDTKLKKDALVALNKGLF
ncbi:MAG: aspartate kinase [Bacteroidetes bacterium RIFCSPLOWO2_12_FULL_35_15]|nr:MAG: aspartate kinase [Bacteroidetes bacterium RIFCSPLOWO2_12_FULL_35_15]